MQFIRIPGLNPGFGADLLDSVYRDDTERRGLAQVVRALPNRPRAPVLRVAVVQEGVRPRVDDLGRQR